MYLFSCLLRTTSDIFTSLLKTDVPYRNQSSVVSLDLGVRNKLVLVRARETAWVGHKCILKRMEVNAKFNMGRNANLCV